MEPSMSTKDIYLIEALRLFADKGYEATGVVEIAKKVGVTTSALYKHYSNKKALFDAIIEKSKEGFQGNMQRLHIDLNNPDEVERILHMDENAQIIMIRNIFETIAISEYPRLFRKLIIVEQYKHPELAEIFNQYYIEKQVSFFEKMMKIWVDGNIMKEEDPRMMAIQYISPVILSIEMYDRNPDRKDEIINYLEKHIIQFNRMYRK